MEALTAEASITAAFLVAVALGFRRDPRIIVVALFAHGAFDSVHAHLVDNPGVPPWWPQFCLAYDATAAACLALLLVAAKRREPRNRYEALA